MGLILQIQFHLVRQILHLVSYHNYNKKNEKDKVGAKQEGIQKALKLLKLGIHRHHGSHFLIVSPVSGPVPAEIVAGIDGGENIPGLGKLKP